MIQVKIVIEEIQNVILTNVLLFSSSSADIQRVALFRNAHMQLTNHLQHQVREQDSIEEQIERETQAPHDHHARPGDLHVHDAHAAERHRAHIPAQSAQQQAVQAPGQPDGQQPLAHLARHQLLALRVLGAQLPHRDRVRAQQRVRRESGRLGRGRESRQRHHALRHERQHHHDARQQAKASAHEPCRGRPREHQNKQ